MSGTLVAGTRNLFFIQLRDQFLNNITASPNAPFFAQYLSSGQVATVYPPQSNILSLF